MYLAIQTLGLASLQECHSSKGNNISNKCNIVKNPNWHEADYLQSVTEGLITWRISTRAEISTRLTGLKFCCDYMTNFSPFSNRENRCIDSLAVWPFGGAQFSAFWDGNSLQDHGTEATETCLWLHISQLESRCSHTLSEL